MCRYIAVVDVSRDIGKELTGDGVCRLIEEDQIDRHGVGAQEFLNGVYRHLQGLVFGISVYTGGNEREGYVLTAVCQGQFQRSAVGGDQQLPFPIAAAPPDGSHSVDDKFGGQAVTLGDFGLSCFAALTYTDVR